MLQSKAAAIQAQKSAETAKGVEAMREQLDRIEAKLDRILAGGEPAQPPVQPLKKGA